MNTIWKLANWQTVALRLAAIGVIAVLILGAAADTARFEKLGHQMMCTCGCNQILLECNHVGCPASEGMRNELTSAIGGPGNDAKVLATFVTKYGPTVLAAPATTGFSLTAWVMPFAVFFGGIAVVAFVARHWSRRVQAAAPGAESMGPAQLEELRARARRETEL